MPYVCVLGILVYNSGIEMWSNYLILPFMYFSSKYAFSCGIAHVLSTATEDVNGRLSIQAEPKENEGFWARRLQNVRNINDSELRAPEPKENEWFWRLSAPASSGVPTFRKYIRNIWKTNDSEIWSMEAWCEDHFSAVITQSTGTTKHNENQWFWCQPPTHPHHRGGGGIVSGGRGGAQRPAERYTKT